MRLLYVFPHPDDESFGPALAIAAQRRAGHEVYLLTLTRGGATSERSKLGLSVDEMGTVRLAEMKRMSEVLGLSGMTVLDFPDSGLDSLDPRLLEEVVRSHVEHVRPQVLVTYAVHGVSGHPDHLVTHAVVKRVYCELRATSPADAGALRGAGDPIAPRRLALFTLTEEGSPGPDDPLRTTPLDRIGCSVEVKPSDVRTAREALDCYETYQDVIREADPLGRVGSTVHFELFSEQHDHPLGSLVEGL